MPVSDIGAGVEIARHFGVVRSDLLTLCDRLPSKLALCDARGHILHANEALQALMDSTDQKIVRAAIHRAVAALLSETASCPERAECFYARASWVGPREPGAGGLVVVLVEGGNPNAITARRLVQERGLTAREADVALLLASGKSNKAIAVELGLSSHTVKRHTERVLVKLEVRGRAAVAAAIAELPSDMPESWVQRP